MPGSRRRFLFDGEIVFKVRPYTGHEGIPTETRDGIVMWRFPRDDRPSPRPVKDGFRIVVLGDSVLFPAGVADADGAARRLERLLNEHLDGGPYEVVDLAEPGFNTQQEERTLLDSGLPLQPDLVLVGVTPNDDQEFALENGQLMEVRFLRHMRARGANGAFQALAQRSYLYNWLWLARETTVDVPVEDVDPLIEAPLRRMHAAARQHDADLAVMCFPDYYGPRAERLDPRRDRCRFQRIAEWAAAARVPTSISWTQRRRTGRPSCASTRSTARYSATRSTPLRFSTGSSPTTSSRTERFVGAHDPGARLPRVSGLEEAERLVER